MKFNKILAVSSLVSTFGLAGVVAQADPVIVHESTTQTTVTKTTPMPVQSQSSSSSTMQLSDTDSQALSVHDRAVDLAHRATAAAQRGDKKMAASLAAQAQALYNQAYRTTNFYAHRRDTSDDSSF